MFYLIKFQKNKTGKIFESVNVDNYDLLLNTHIKLLLDKNICINIIRKNLDFQCLNDFEKRYNFLLSKSLRIILKYYKNFPAKKCNCIFKTQQ